jgi:hypothetical protein
MVQCNMNIAMHYHGRHGFDFPRRAMQGIEQVALMMATPM